MRNYDDDWTDSQRALYDECYQAGSDWAQDPETPSDDVQYVINLAEGDDDSLGDSELDYPPLVDAVTEATGENITSVPASHDDPAFRGFVDGVRDGIADDTFGL
ncbi:MULTISPECIES: hypothetical protein [Micromonospora]|uniref:Uncharacterized protein n=1 Tax=Micromonospora musae TaxID=1894970 RepID=A0A3A9YES8_9ACTN|nr:MULTISPECIES: hypothetical protein [Micromonospora]RKN15040.1 hypothetical protein D7147_26765 [Micromonospora musae]RKN35698.1 hypothetical protein D7044_04450 [Micromonospora musae]TDC40239.1 hypothetical protein E1211_01775 [Micromonospora sp. 15K316]TYB99253.1 hypothetical protein FXF53_15935 [Micromonospora sp. WP24]